MIKHHPSETLLTQYCAATLPASLSLAVSIHVDMCPVCQAKVEKLEASNAHAVFSDNMDVTTVTVGTHCDFNAFVRAKFSAPKLIGQL